MDGNALVQAPLQPFFLLLQLLVLVFYRFSIEIFTSKASLPSQHVFRLGLVRESTNSVLYCNCGDPLVRCASNKPLFDGEL